MTHMSHRGSARRLALCSSFLLLLLLAQKEVEWRFAGHVLASAANQQRELKSSIRSCIHKNPRSWSPWLQFRCPA